jgi:hypothetical protein
MHAIPNLDEPLFLTKFLGEFKVQSTNAAKYMVLNMLTMLISKLNNG